MFKVVAVQGDPAESYLIQTGSDVGRILRRGPDGWTLYPDDLLDTHFAHGHGYWRPFGGDERAVEALAVTARQSSP